MARAIKKTFGIPSGARADVAETVQNSFVRQHMTCGDDIRDAGFIIVGGIALGVTGYGHESCGKQERGARNGGFLHCHGTLPARGSGGLRSAGSVSTLKSGSASAAC
jgi:hypothetical protein